MSKNHPTDNIYTILGKLDALKPTQEEERFALVKEIRESVEAQGSILSGVDAVQAKLAKQFSESVDEVAPPGAKAERMVKGIKKSLSKDGHLSDKDKAIAYATTWKAHNKGQVEEDYDPVANVKQIAQEYMNSVGYTSVDQLEAEDIESIAGDAQINYQDVCEILGCQLPDSLGPVDSYDEHGDLEEGCTCNEGACAMHEGTDEKFHSDRVALFGKINKVIQGIQTPEQYKNSLGWLKRAFVKLNSDQTDEPTFSSKAIQRIHQDSRAMEKDLAAKARELGIEPQSFFEAEITRTDGKTVHRKTDFPGYPVDEPEDIEDENKGKRGRPRKHAAKAPTGLGRGRPTKPKAPTYSKQADPFGRISGAVPKGNKGTVHSLGEAMTQLELSLTQNLLTEGRYLEDGAGETLQHILNRFRAEVRNFEQGGDLDNDLYDALYDYYVEAGEMPYGVQKARTGDPMRWVAEHLEAELGDIAYGKDPANAEAMEAGIPGSLPPEQIPGKEDLLKGKGRSYYEEDSLEEELNELARLAGVTTSEGNAFTGKLKDTPKGGEFELDGKTFKDTSSLSEVDLEETEDESPKADKDYDQDGEIESEKDEVIGSRRKAAGLDESTSFDGGESSDFNISTNMSSDGEKNVTVTATGEHAATLLQMLRIAGLGDSHAAQELQAEPCGMEEPEVMVIDAPEEVVDEEGIEVDHPAVAPQNAPNEKYGTIKNITTQGDDMNREKSQDPGTANKAANPLTNAQSVLKAVAQLESKLAEEYESIKKVSK